MDWRQVKEDSPVSGLRKWDKEAHPDECARSAEGRRDGEGHVGNVQPASLHLFWGLNQLAFHFAPIRLIEQTSSELYLAVFCVTRSTPQTLWQSPVPGR